MSESQDCDLCGEALENCSCDDETKEFGTGYVGYSPSVKEPAIVHKFPVKLWYSSKTHKQDRYYAGFDRKSHRVLWSYAPAEAVQISSPDHLEVVQALCRAANYRHLQVHEIES